MGIIIRVRSAKGIDRVEFKDADENVAELYEKTRVKLSLEKASDLELYYDAGLKKVIENSEGLRLSSLGLKHGDMIFGKILKEAEDTTVKDDTDKRTLITASTGNREPKLEKIKMADIDLQLEKEKGLIERDRDENFCKHGENAMCEYCMPLEPYDSGYLAENKIKHMSFHSYLRKSLGESRMDELRSGKPKSGKLLPLEEPDFQAKKVCGGGGHAPWPEGICTKCQPNAIALQPQEFRMTDHLEFAEASIIDQFLSWWRETGTQRFGFMLGRYEKYPIVPMGIKAVVEAIYEPVQVDCTDGLKVDLQGEEFMSEVKKVEKVAKACGLEIVGMIFSDLTDDGTGKGKVLYSRHKDAYFLSNLEARLAARFQLLYPTATKWSQSEQRFGSRFITAVVSGNENGDVDISAWQVSNIAMALERAELVVGSTNPSLMMVRKPANPKLSKYVPEILYNYKDEYGNNVSNSANPFFPVEYLLVSVTHGFPLNPTPLFKSSSKFQIENRLYKPSLSDLHTHLSRSGLLADLTTAFENLHLDFTSKPTNPCLILSDFHLLFYISTLDIIDFNSGFTLLAKVAVDCLDATSLALLLKVPSFMTFVTVLNQLDMPTTSSANTSNQRNVGASGRYSPMNVDSNSPSAANIGSSSSWSCRHCTFENDSTTEWCSMCGLPQSG